MMRRYYFFRCYRCAKWYYSNKIIKTKKCWKCNHSFQFKNSTKFSKVCSAQTAIEIIKELKRKVEDDSLTRDYNKTEKPSFKKL